MSISHQAVPRRYIKGILEADAVLMSREVSIDGTPFTLSGVYLDRVPQEIGPQYVAIVIQPPYMLQRMGIKHPNGPLTPGVSFGVDVMIQAIDVASDDADILWMQARILADLEGTRGAVTGGKAATCWLEDYPPPQRIDKGSYVFNQIGITFGIGAEVG
jgi:hypothetical protein